MGCDIVLTVYNKLELTKRCFESLVKYFRSQDHLIIVDNGSNKDTADYLKRIKSDFENISIELVRLRPNRGFIKAANAGLMRSQKEFACLLSNDTIVTEEWLDRMCALAETDRHIGIINPLSSTFGLYPSKGQSIEELAESLKKFSLTYTETAACVGFCMLIKEEVIKKIGGLDEAYGIGYFEDTDYSRRAHAAGFKCLIAKDAYVWHKEHSTFQSKEIEDSFKKNKEIFYKRWGKPLRILCVLDKSLEKAKERKKTLDFCLRLAGKGNWLWVVAPNAGYKKNIEILKSHANIKLFFVPRLLLFFYSLFILLKKRKKKIDKVYLDKYFSKRTKSFLGFIFARRPEEISYESES